MIPNDDGGGIPPTVLFSSRVFYGQVRRGEHREDGCDYARDADYFVQYRQSIIVVGSIEDDDVPLVIRRIGGRYGGGGAMIVVFFQLTRRRRPVAMRILIRAVRWNGRGRGRRAMCIVIFELKMGGFRSWIIRQWTLARR